MVLYCHLCKTLIYKGPILESGANGCLSSSHLTATEVDIVVVSGINSQLLIAYFVEML